MKISGLLTLCAIDFLLSACAFPEKIQYSKLPQPYSIIATRNYLPQDVKMVASYTIYENSKWICNYQTAQGASICCLSENFSTMSPWKYCLLVDHEENGFGFAELGTGDILKWSEGKQQLFRKISEQSVAPSK